MHCNGITNHFILYTVPKLIGNHLSMVSFTTGIGKNSKIITAGEPE